MEWDGMDERDVNGIGWMGEMEWNNIAVYIEYG